MMAFGGWGLETSHHECQRGMKLASKMTLYKYFTYQRAPDIPTKFPSLSDKQVEKINAEVKHALEEDTPGHGKYSHLHTRLLASVGTQS